ncbi:hypothetical protein BS78_K166000 [Paspalum vaginatum]|uniref:SIAH-type domain-containing protein n=1 Tax=Paspalum vaginatum TaxID=158149 RepID=A0A9W8CEE9_9POAL|nr:hypothetical protein BS78_K166000 [Paspalum vaginatum]
MPIRPYSRRTGSAAAQIAGWGRKRTRYSLPSPPPQDPEDDDSDDDAEEDDGESGSETESGSESDDSDESSDGSDDGDDAMEDQQGGEEEQPQRGEQGQPPPPPAQRNGGDDHDRIRIGVARRRGSTALPPPSSSGSSSVSVIGDATVENTGALDCGICFLPLKPPIFQQAESVHAFLHCNVGHVVCSPCYEKLGQQATKCHVCRAPTPGGYRRCHAMEQLLNSIRVPCPHAAHGCAARPAYHDRDGHARACAHAPCHCPTMGCGFAGSTTALFDHVATAHQCPCTTEKDDGTGFYVSLRQGFNFVTASASASHGAATDNFLLLLNLERAPVYRVVTVFCVHPYYTGTATLKLRYRHYGCSDMCHMHHQSSEFSVVCTDLSNGILPGPPCNCYPFFLPRCHREEEDGATKVLVEIIAPPIE